MRNVKQTGGLLHLTTLKHQMFIALYQLHGVEHERAFVLTEQAVQEHGDAPMKDAMALDRLIADALEFPDMDTPVQAVPVARNHRGEWSHPALPHLSDNDDRNYRTWASAKGLKWMSYYEECDGITPDWMPAAPEGDGWFLLSIGENEDGAYAWWVQPCTSPATEEAVA